MALVDWEDLAISVRKSPRKLYNVLKDELGLPEWNELSVIERRSRKRRFAMVRSGSFSLSKKNRGWWALHPSIRLFLSRWII